MESGGTSFLAAILADCVMKYPKLQYSIAASDPPCDLANKNVNKIDVLRGSDMGLKY